MFIIFILSFIPVVIWALIEPLASRFMDFSSSATSLGQIFGLVGMVLFSINLILAGRFKFLDKYFKGLDKVYAHHSRIGSIAFSMLLFHPIFLVIRYLLISTQDAALFFVPFINMPVTWGIISLFMMIVLLSVTFYIKLKYHIWKMSHKFMLLSFFFASLHTFFIYSDISRSSLLRFYVLLFTMTGLFVGIRKTFFSKFLVSKFEYKVKNTIQLNKDILEIEMEPVSNKMNFKSGQFAFFSFISGGVTPESHPFSISSASVDNNIKITVKNLGDYTSLLVGLKPNDGVLIDGPYGHFSYQNFKSKNQIWIAGGIGITPFLSMARVLESEYNIDMYYSVKENSEAVYLKDFEDISLKNPNFKFNLWDASLKGYINSGLVVNLSKGFADKDIFLCGPPMFMESLKNQFVVLGVDIKKIHYENFSF
ncbi:MAG: ferric reductase-like transmembrane domain-containing protein [Candidatus Nomurabacteria bacterium]|nr:ferric reductase-like transmembrane domain-containing protein [Candidatus Nomurabacteria bacterium]